MLKIKFIKEEIKQQKNAKTKKTINKQFSKL